MDAQWLNKDEAVRLLGVPETLFDRLEEEGTIPGVLRYSQRTVLYQRRVIEAVGVLLPVLLERLSSPNARTKKATSQES